MTEPSSDAPILEEETSVHVGEPDSKGRRVSPWSWVPTVYFAQGLQYAVVIQLFIVIFFTMGVPVSKALYWIGLLQLPWTIKPLWGPLVDRYWTKRQWTYTMQLLVGLAFVGAGFCLFLPGMGFFIPVVAFLFGLAIAAATHDIACDGYYMMGLNEKQQAFFVGIRSTVFRVAMIFANAILIVMAGYVQSATGLKKEEVKVQVSPAVAADAEVSKTKLDVFRMETWPSSSEQAVLMMPETLDETAGDKGYLTVRLAQAPEEGKTRAVTLRLKSGKGGIAIEKKDQRIELTKDNWQEGVTIPVTTDKKTKKLAVDTIIAQSGNIPLSWWVVCVFCGGMFITIAIYHRFILPYPTSDATDTKGRPFFLWPAFLLAITIGVPWGFGWGIFKGLEFTKPAVQAATIGEVKYEGLQDLRMLVEVKEATDGKEADKPVSVAEMMTLVDKIHSTSLAASASELKQLRDLSAVMKSSGLVASDNYKERLYDFLQKRKEDPSLYGNEDLVRLITMIKAANKDAIPETKEELTALLEKAASPEIADMPGDTQRSLTALVNVEKAIKDKQGKDALAAAAAGTDTAADALPKDRAEIEEVVALAKETPSKLAVKGFDFFFTAARLIVLLIIGAIILWTPLWAIPRAFFRALSDASQIGFADVFGTFFSKSGMGVTLGFMLTFRLGEAQLAQVKSPFLLAGRADGGLAMSLGEFAFTNGVVYLAALTVGGLLGGFLISRYGLKKTIWIMVGFMHLPNLLYIFLAAKQPEGLTMVNTIVGFESFGYGLGFTAYLMVMILAAQGPYKTAHYALCTGAMALGYMVPGMWAGYLQELVGYTQFFALVMVFVIPGILFIPFMKIDPNFGRKAHTSAES